MAMRDRVFRVTDKPRTWTRAILLGVLIWMLAILFLSEVPSVIIYKFDRYIAEWGWFVVGCVIIGLVSLGVAGNVTKKR